MSTVSSVYANEVASYETPSPENSAYYIQQSIIDSAHYSVSPQVENDGFDNHYQILNSDLGAISVITSEFAGERLHELDIIKAIGEIKQTDAFVKGFQASVDTTMKAAEQALNDPEKAVKNLEKGFSRFLDNVGATVSEYSKNKENDSDKKSTDKNMIKEYLGVYSEKRKLAVEFGVDPYSSNEVLQKHLEDLATAVVAGGASLDVALQSAPGAASAVRKTAAMMQEGAQNYLLTSPKILKFNIVEKLSDQEFSGETIDGLLNSSACSLRHITTAAAVLIGLGKKELNQQIFPWVLGAEDENECRQRMHMMELAWEYRRTKAVISSLWVISDQLYWRDSSGIDGIPIITDHLFWTSKLENMLAKLKSDKKVAWISGETSDRVVSEMSDRRFALSVKKFSDSNDRQNIGNRVLNGSELPEPEHIPEIEPVIVEQEQSPVSEPVEYLSMNEVPEPEHIPEEESIVVEEEQNPTPEPVEELTRVEAPELESTPKQETVVLEQEQSPTPEPVKDPLLSLSSKQEPEQPTQVLVQTRDCWEHPKLGKFIFEQKDQTTQLIHKVPSRDKAPDFSLTSIGNQYYWKTNKGEHVFIKEIDKVTLLTNIHSNKAETILTKCNNPN
ncbi:MAG: hypothetical protein HN764_16645 [Gammaproteobacteria bacterium]|nr:hypothetical protein [Gammaproteobacteria bacterium]